MDKKTGTKRTFSTRSIDRRVKLNAASQPGVFYGGVSLMTAPTDLSIHPSIHPFQGRKGGGLEPVPADTGQGAAWTSRPSIQCQNNYLLRVITLDPSRYLKNHFCVFTAVNKINRGIFSFSRRILFVLSLSDEFCLQHVHCWCWKFLTHTTGSGSINDNVEVAHKRPALQQVRRQRTNPKKKSHRWDLLLHTEWKGPLRSLSTAWTGCLV